MSHFAQPSNVKFTKLPSLCPGFTTTTEMKHHLELQESFQQIDVCFDLTERLKPHLVFASGQAQFSLQRTRFTLHVGDFIQEFPHHEFYKKTNIFQKKFDNLSSGNHLNFRKLLTRFSFPMHDKLFYTKCWKHIDVSDFSVFTPCCVCKIN